MNNLLPAGLAESTAPATLGVLAKLGQQMVDAIKTRDVRINALETRLDRLTQKMSALQKELAALARREAGGR